MKKSGFGKLKKGRPKTVRLSQDDLVRETSLDTAEGTTGEVPRVLSPAASHVNLLAWAADRQAELDEKLGRSGGLLFRGFHLETVPEFEDFVRAACGEALEYRERSSPRSKVEGHIYTSTDYPPEYPIFLHNEQSYNNVFPRKILFFCVIPAETGGETPVASSRNLYRRIDPAIRQRFEEEGYLYVRNFGDGCGLTWQEAFQTSSKEEIKAYGHDNGIEMEWRDGDRLRTRQRRRAVATHPKTGEKTWFNHATFFHVSSLVPAVRDAMLREFAEEDLPNNTYHGNGDPIAPEALEHLRRLYAEESVAFPWQKGDVLMLDNMLMTHGRSPFSGARKVVVGMSDPTAWSDV